MLTRASEYPRPARRVLRWTGLATITATAALVLAGCTAGDLAQSGKNVGDEPAESASLVGTIDPLGELVTPHEFPEGERSGTVNAEEGTLKAAAYETAKVPRIHLTIASPDGAIEKRGETYRNKPNKDKRHECVDESSGGAVQLIKEPMVLDSVKAGGTGRSCLEEKGDPELEVTYALPGTTDIAWVYTKVPDWGDNILQCSIIDPKTWKTNPSSTWACDFRWLQDGGHGWNPMPKVVFRNKGKPIVMEDSAEAQKILNEYCSDGQPQCKFKATTQEVVNPDESKWRLLSYFDNCGSVRDESAFHIWKDEVKHKATHSIGGSIMGGAGIEHVVNVEVSAEYEHLWSEEFTYTASVKQPVAWGWANFFYAQEAYLHIQGDFTVSAPKATYQINNADFRLPLSKQWNDGKGHTIEPQNTTSLGYPVTCPNDDVIPKGGLKSASDKQRAQLLKTNPAYVPGTDMPTAEWLTEHGTIATEIG